MFDFDRGCDVDLLCRDDRCELAELHPSHKISASAKRVRDRSQLWRHEPWRTACPEALRLSVLSSVSFVEPRNFGMILAHVENDYGSCCARSVHRHLVQLRSGHEIVRMEFRGNIHAYLRSGSRLISDPALVLEQSSMFYGEV